jgi:hypothetical protein
MDPMELGRVETGSWAKEGTMKKPAVLWWMVLALGWVGTVWGQARTGSIFGTVTDPEGKPLPGVTVTLRSSVTGQLTTVTDEGGNYRFPSLPPATDYQLRFELSGFRPVVRSDVVVQVGANVQINVQMAPGVAEEVVVRGAAPVVDVKKTTVATNLTSDVLQSIPSARDPWVMLELAPGIIVDRVNVGGSQSGQQSGFAARGTDIANWMYDGIETTEGGGFGGSGGYFDFDAFEEMQVVAGANDVSTFIPGIVINIVAKRGSNRFSGGPRAYWTAKALQAKNVTDEEIRQKFLSPTAKGNRVGNIWDVGANVAGPVVSDKLWFWIGYNAQRIEQLIPLATGQDHADKTQLDILNTKWNLQLGNHMLEFLLYWDNKRKQGRGAEDPRRSPETTWDQAGPVPLLKAQDEWFIRNDLFVSARVGVHAISWHLKPRGGLDKPVMRDLKTLVWYNTYLMQDLEEPAYHGSAEGVYYRSRWLGGDHEIKFGTDVRHKPGVFSVQWGNGSRIMYNDITRPELGGRLELIRPSRITRYHSRFSLYAQDTFRTGRLTLLLGLRYDLQRSGLRDGHLDALPLRPDLFPAADVKGRNVLTWHTFSPRVGLTYDLRGNARTILKANFALYPEPIGYDAANVMSPLSARTLWFQWLGDRNGNRLPDPDELGRLIFWDHEPGNPNRVVNAVDLKSPKYLEFVLGVEQQVGPDIGVALEGFWRRMWDLRWQFPYDPDGRVTADQIYDCWVEAGRIPADWGGWPYYYCTIPKPSGVLLTNQPDYVQTYWGVELRFTKRMSRRWMTFGSVTLQDQREHFDSRRAYVDPSNIDQRRDAPYWTSCFGTACLNARWMAKAGVVVNLPLDFDVGLSVNAREGYIFAPSYRVTRISNGWGSDVFVYVDKIGRSRYPTFWMVNARVEKRFSTPYGRLTLALDGFNVTNNAIVLQWFDLASTPANFKKIQEITAPRVFRLGARLDF